jgi:hypothetical protein
VVREAVAEPAGSPFESALAVLTGGFRRLPSREPGCAHGQLVFDDINDVHCNHCGEDFTD